MPRKTEEQKNKKADAKITVEKNTKTCYYNKVINKERKDDRNNRRNIN